MQAIWPGVCQLNIGSVGWQRSESSAREIRRLIHDNEFAQAWYVCLTPSVVSTMLAQGSAPQHF